MKKRIIITIVLIALISTAGCGSSQKSQENTLNSQSETIIKTEKDFLALHREWTQRLESIATRTDRYYNEWTSGKQDTEKFLDNLDKLRKEIKELNRETDLTTNFELNESEKKKADYDSVVESYARTSKYLNDFLESAMRLPDEQIKLQYIELIKVKYQNNLTELKKYLNK